MTDLAVELLHLHRSRPSTYLYADGLEDRYQLLAIDRAYTELEQAAFVSAGPPKSAFGVPKRTFIVTEKGKRPWGSPGRAAGWTRIRTKILGRTPLAGQKRQ